MKAVGTMHSGLHLIQLRWWRSLVAAAVMMAITAASVQATPPAAIQQAVVLVAKRNPETRQYLPIGTAFHIGDGWFRTAAHVATATLPRRYEGKGFDEWAIFSADEFGNPARWIGRFEVVCVDRRWHGKDEDTIFPHDSALLKLISDMPPGGMMKASERRPAVGDPVSVWGFPEGLVLFEARARVNGVTNDWIAFQDELGKPTIGGHSGSPVLDSSGGVIGILSGGAPGLRAQERAVPIWDAEAGCPKP